MKGIKYALLLAVVVRFSIECLAGSVTGNGDVALCLTEPGRHDFVFDGREAIVVTPDSVATGSPWIWRPAFFGAFDTVDRALLKKGFHVVYYDLTHGQGLAIITPAWMKYVLNSQTEKRFAGYAEKVWRIPKYKFQEMAK